MECQKTSLETMEIREEEITNKEDLTQEAKELLLTRKQLPLKFRQSLTELDLKYCTGCKEVLELENFRVSATSSSGRAGRCYECHPLKQTDTEFDFSTDPTEWTLARSIAALRRACKKQGLPVELFGVAEVLEYFQLPRSQVPAVSLRDPEQGFILENLSIQYPPIPENEEN